MEPWRCWTAHHEWDCRLNSVLWNSTSRIHTCWHRSCARFVRSLDSDCAIRPPIVTHQSESREKRPSPRIILFTCYYIIFMEFHGSYMLLDYSLWMFYGFYNLLDHVFWIFHEMYMFRYVCLWILHVVCMCLDNVLWIHMGVTFC